MLVFVIAALGNTNSCLAILAEDLNWTKFVFLKCGLSLWKYSSWLWPVVHTIMYARCFDMMVLGCYTSTLVCRSTAKEANGKVEIITTLLIRTAELIYWHISKIQLCMNCNIAAATAINTMTWKDIFLESVNSQPLCQTFPFSRCSSAFTQKPMFTTWLPKSSAFVTFSIAFDFSNFRELQRKGCFVLS